MQNLNNAEQLAQIFLKLALLLQAGQKIGVFSSNQQAMFEPIKSDFEFIKTKIEDLVMDATIEKATVIEGDPIAELLDALAVDQDIDNTFFDVGLDVQNIIEDIKADIKNESFDNL